jgi:catalase
MLQGRLFAYGDAHRYRLGINHTHIPVNAPKAAAAHNYGRDGAMATGDNGGAARNYEPNSFGGPVETGRPHAVGLAGDGVSGAYPQVRHSEDDDFVQAGDLYRLMAPDAQDRLAATIAASLAQVSRDDIVDRALAHFVAADPAYGAAVAAKVRQLRPDPPDAGPGF